MNWSLSYNGNLRVWESQAYSINEVLADNDEKQYRVFHYGKELCAPRWTIENAKEVCEIYEGKQ